MTWGHLQRAKHHVAMGNLSRVSSWGPKGGGPTSGSVPTTAARLRPAAPAPRLELPLTTSSQASEPTKDVSLRLLQFLALQKLRLYFGIRAGFFFSFQKFRREFQGKLGPFVMRPRTEGWAVSSFHLVQPSLPALWDKSHSRNDKDS